MESERLAIMARGFTYSRARNLDETNRVCFRDM